MVHEELFARLNEVGYKNWLKAGYCLLKVKDGLCGFVDDQMRDFHNIVINSNTVLLRGKTCKNNCRPKNNQFQSVCPLCSEWKREILKHHTKPSGVINWGNCRPWLWPIEHWELAKAFMPRGQGGVTRAENCDAAAILNLLHLCDHFSSINHLLVTQVIHCRNELMHSCEMRVSDQWMAHFQKSLDQLLMQLRHVPEVAAAARQIQEMLSVDLSVHVPGVDGVDGATGIEIESISLWETELLRESLRDLLNTDEHDGAPVYADLQRVQMLHRFLSGHQDLEEQFRSELLSIQGLEEHLQSLNSDHEKQ